MYADTQPEPTTTPQPPRKRRMRRVTALAAAGGLVVATATGVGYAAGDRGPASTSRATAQPGLASQNDGYGWSYGAPVPGQSDGTDDQSSPFPTRPSRRSSEAASPPTRRRRRPVPS